MQAYMCAGIVLNIVGLIVIAFCSRHGPLWLGAILIGLGGITFHLAQVSVVAYRMCVYTAQNEA